MIRTLMSTRHNKTQLARECGVSRASLYYQPKRDTIDMEIKEQILGVLRTHRSYGHKRIALALKLNKKRILRVMKKYGIKPYRRRVRRPAKHDDLGKPPTSYPNLIKDLCPIRPTVIWVTDFTYIHFQDTFLYLATIMDLYTREIVGFHVSAYHNSTLVVEALRHAITQTGSVPLIIHSDQGSEYDSTAFTDLATAHDMMISMSHKHAPWENGYQESFYAHFKVDLGFVSQFDSVEELIEGLYLTIHYYNHDRIHTRLKMSPVQFKQQFERRLHNTV